ncbi:MAG: cell division protein FtsZ [Bryobacterales bacterium]|nr:cell division protein FtsZ [Bryobacterales bacterium]
MKFDIQDDVPEGTRIKVIGVGGAGCNAVGRMFRQGVRGVEFYVVNTDKQALHASPVPNKLLIGHRVTGGLGAGSDPAMGKEAAMESTGEILEILDGAQMVFVAAGMGGGTGTGAAPMIASWAREMNALTVGIVTLPFGFEGSRRKRIAEKGIEELVETVDTLIRVPNEKLKSLVPKGTPLTESFQIADGVLEQAVSGIAEIVNTAGMVNRDFADVRAIMQGMGRAMVGCATASGENAVMEAAREAVNSPLLEEDEMRGARGMLIQIAGSSQISLDAVDEACMLVQEAADNEDVNLNFGVSIDEAMGDRVKVTVIATGFEEKREVEPEPVIVAPPVVAPVVRQESVVSPVPVAMPVTPEPEVAAPPTRVSYFTAPSLPVPPVVAPAVVESAPVVEPEPEPVAEMEHETEHAMAAVANGASHLDEPAKVMDDLDVPAFLRKERRWWS